jgi:putative addiction module component (TIGR02574 family)
MAKSLTEIEKLAQALTHEDRARLAESLLQSLVASPVAEIQSAWDKEVAERIAAYERGDAEVFSAESVFAEARRQLP